MGVRQRDRSDAQPETVSGRSVARLAKHVDTALSHVDLSLAQYRVLVLLSKGSAVASALASRLAVSPPSVTALVDGLVARGLVEREAVAGDRRRVVHVLTNAGRRVLADGDAAVQQRLTEIASFLSPIERTQAVRGLSLWHSAMDSYLEARMTTSGS